MTKLQQLALLILSTLAVIAFVGCGTAEMVTMKAEFAASALNSTCFHVIDGADQLVTDNIRVKLLNGDHDGATQDYADYKPKIEKWRAGCNASDDAVQNAEKERLKIPVGGDVKNFTAWLPALEQAISIATQIVAEVKGFLK